MRPLKVLAWMAVIMVSGANSTFAQEDQSQGWQIQGKNGPVWVYQVNRFGEDTLEDEDTLKPEEQKLVKALREVPNLKEVRFIPSTKAHASLEAVLDVTYERMEIQGNASKTKLQKRYYPICGDSRYSVGKLLFCLERFKKMTEVDLAVWKKFEDDAKTDSDKNSAQERIKGLKIFQQHLAFAKEKIAEDSGIDTVQLEMQRLNAPKNGKEAVASSGLWEVRKTNPGGSPLRKGDEKNIDLLKCESTQGEANSARQYSAQGVVPCVKDGSTEMFSNSMFKVLGSVDGPLQTTQYLEALRMVAIGRIISSYEKQTGQHLSFSQCGPFNEEIQQRTQTPIVSGNSVSGSPSSRNNLRFQAMQLLKLQTAMKALDEKDDDESAEELQALKEAFAERLAEFPLLMTAVDTKIDLIDQDLKAFKELEAAQEGSTELKDSVDVLKEKLKADTEKTLVKFCSGKNSDWAALAEIPELGDEVEKSFGNVFHTIRQCVDFHFSKKTADDRHKDLMMMLGSTVGCSALVFFPGVSHACGVLIPLYGAWQWNESDKRLEWTKACVAASGGDPGKKRACGSKSYLDAQADYRQARNQYFVSMALGVLPGGAKFLVKSLKKGKSLARMSESELQRDTRILRSREGFKGNPTILFKIERKGPPVPPRVQAKPVAEPVAPRVEAKPVVNEPAPSVAGAKPYDAAKDPKFLKDRGLGMGGKPTQPAIYTPESLGLPFGTRDLTVAYGRVGALKITGASTRQEVTNAIQEVAGHMARKRGISGRNFVVEHDALILIDTYLEAVEKAAKAALP